MQNWYYAETCLTFFWLFLQKLTYHHHDRVEIDDFLVIKSFKWLLPRFTIGFALFWLCKKIVKLQPVFVALSEINRGTKSCCIYRNQILILSPYHFIETSLSASLAKKTNVFTVFGLLTCTIQNTTHATMSIWSKKRFLQFCVVFPCTPFSRS